MRIMFAVATILIAVAFAIAVGSRACDTMRRSQNRRCLQVDAGTGKGACNCATAGNRENSMTSFDDLKPMIRRNKLLGLWAAEKLGLAGPDADAYADDLAVATIDPDRSDVFSKVRKDFDAAGVVQSDEQILRLMDKLMLEAANQAPTARGGSSDAAAVMLVRRLTS
jgi:hypothetical protein